MSEKHLTETAWKTLATKKHLKDGELTKALAVLAKTDEDDAAAQGRSLDKVLACAESLKKENKSDSEIVGYLDEVIKEARKNKAASKKASADDGADDEEDAVDDEAEEYQKDYKGKLTAAMAQVKGRAPVPGAPPKPQLKFLAMVGSKASAVLVAANVAGPAKKVLRSLAGGAGGAFVSGECIFERAAHTFIVETVPAGLAKKLASALRAQTGNSYKVRVRTQDGSVVLDDETDTDLDAADAEASTAAEPSPDLEARWKALKAQVLPEIKTALGANPPNRAEIARIVGAAGASEKAADFQAAINHFTQLRSLLGGAVAAGQDEDGQREGESYEDYLDRHTYTQSHQSLSEHLAHALREQLGDTAKMRAVMAFAEEKAAAGNFKSAAKALEALEKLIEQAAHASHEKEGASDNGASKVRFEQIHLDWDSAKKTVDGQLTALRQAILAEFDDAEAVKATDNLQNVLARFNEGLGDTIDALRGSDDAAQRRQFASKATDIANRYLGYLDSSALITHVQANPYEIGTSLRDTLSAPLNAVKAELAKASG